jgi:hypothetical protein
VKDHVQFSLVFCIYVFVHNAHVSLYFSDGMNYLVVDGTTRTGKGVYDDVLKSSTHHRGAFHPHVSPPSPPMSLVSLEQLLVSQNAIMLRSAKIGEYQAGHSQQHQQPQDFSYLDFLATHPLEFAETVHLLEANHWL